VKLGYKKAQDFDNILAYAAQKHRDWKGGGWQNEGFVRKWGPAEFVNTYHRQRWRFLRSNKFKIISEINYKTVINKGPKY
jgi:hypothetical protein